jgi:hypothetical protein
MAATSGLEAELSSRTKEASKKRLSSGSERGAAPILGAPSLTPGRIPVVTEFFFSLLFFTDIEIVASSPKINLLYATMHRAACRGTGARGKHMRHPR